MAEYIDLDTPLELYVERGGFCKKQISTLRDLLDTNRITYKTADVRPVVRCGECKYWKSYGNTEHHLCTYVAGASFIRKKNDFCSRGEKREES